MPRTQRGSKVEPRVPVDGAIASEERRANPNGIARRAYERYCERGCEDGHDVEDWLAAERDLNAS
jgi:hypothetical protein